MQQSMRSLSSAILKWQRAVSSSCWTSRSSSFGENGVSMGVQVWVFIGNTASVPYRWFQDTIFQSLGEKSCFYTGETKKHSRPFQKRLEVLLHAKRRANNKPSSVFDNNLSNPYVAIRLKPPHRNTTGRRIVPVGCCFG